MKPVKTKLTNCIYAENQPEYIPLPVEKTAEGRITSCWKLSLIERLYVFLFGKIYISIMTFNQPLQPIRPFILKDKK